MREMITRSKAKEIGQTWYFTGKECPHGHVSHRWVSTGGCSACVNENTARKRKENPEGESERRRQHYKKNIEKLRAESRKYRERNRDALNEKKREKRVKHPEHVKVLELKWRKSNKDIIREVNKRTYASNPERVKENARRWAENNKDRRKQIMREYDSRNKANRAECQRRREAQKIHATPQWLTPDQLREMREIYAECARITRETGVPHHVDHIFPLKSKIACGLHVPWNLQILPAIENIRKGNRF